VALPAVFLTPPLTASALCAIFLAILIGAAFHGFMPPGAADAPAGTCRRRGLRTPATPGIAGPAVSLVLAFSETRKAW
jgi:hypothetical protein